MLLILKQVLTSNIFVGSSNNNKSGRQNKALANARRIRQPPENVFVALRCLSAGNPNPDKIAAALKFSINISDDY